MGGKKRFHLVGQQTKCEPYFLLLLRFELELPYVKIFLLGRYSKNQNGNLRWHLPLGVRPPCPLPPLMAKFPDIFSPHFFSFATESYIYETDFTLQKYHF